MTKSIEMVPHPTIPQSAVCLHAVPEDCRNPCPGKNAEGGEKERKKRAWDVNRLRHHLDPFGAHHDCTQPVQSRSRRRTARVVLLDAARFNERGTVQSGKPGRRDRPHGQAAAREEPRERKVQDSGARIDGRRSPESRRPRPSRQPPRRLETARR